MSKGFKSGLAKLVDPDDPEFDDSESDDASVSSRSDGSNEENSQRSHSNTLSDLHKEATKKIYDLISQTADVYQEAALKASSSGLAGYHARFLRSLVAKDLADKQERTNTVMRNRYSEGLCLR